ncbi:YfdQ family protein [Actinomadura sp. ATCC 31491]|uniref:YfdQ family protein n=1 Tax=Actinomadura luzonensis TaxID=2805427 RepID=A0ABT0G559_9ACTN|nr:DUF2303 family protein [Actinomadura luzonensis]MCK2219741.1 YfdQ family protein [Actinomadura luzonensis]
MPTSDSTRTENDAVIQIAQEAARAESDGVLLEPGNIYAFPTTAGPKLLDLGTDAYLDRLHTPQRKRGTTTVEDVASFLAYYRKHADDSTETYVNVNQLRITAILNAHSADGPRWGDHRLTLQLRTTRAWQAWTTHDGRWLQQREFAEHIEERLEDIREPAAAEMLELAQSFQAKTTVKFNSGTRLASGDMNLTWEETTDATAGAKGQIKIPATFKLAIPCLDLPVVEGDEQVVYGIEARFRYRIERGGGLNIGYLLNDPAPVLRDAVLAVVKQVEDALKTQVLRGTPAGA